MATFRLKSDGRDECRDEWLVAENVSGKRQYLVHTRAPRFVAEILEEDDTSAILGPLSYSLASGQSLGRFVWIDRVAFQTHPVEQGLLDLLGRAGEALAEYDRRLGLEDD